MYHTRTFHSLHIFKFIKVIYGPIEMLFMLHLQRLPLKSLKFC